MAPRRRVFRSAALVSSVLLVGGFIGFKVGVFVFLGGSKSNPAFQFVPGTGPAPAGSPTVNPNGAKSTLSTGGSEPESDPRPVGTGNKHPPSTPAPAGAGE
jgi:hypothetical protein